jgi:hypothetical protein
VDPIENDDKGMEGSTAKTATEAYSANAKETATSVTNMKKVSFDRQPYIR